MSYIFWTGEKLLACGYDESNKFGLETSLYERKFESISFSETLLKEIKGTRCNMRSSIIITGTKIFHCGYALGAYPLNICRNQKFAQLEFDGEVNDLCLGSENMVINSHGRLWGTGNLRKFGLSNPFPRFEPLSFKPLVNKIACGWYHFIILTDNGIFGCGSNSSGQLGLGHTDEVTGIQVIDIEISFADVSCGGYSTMLYNEEELWTFGCNFDGQLGFKSPVNICPTPTRVPIKDRILKIFAGYQHSLILTSHGLYGCGSNSFGELGFKESNQLEVISKIPFYETISDIIIYDSTTVINSEGDLYVCGVGIEIIFGVDPKILGFQRVHLKEKIIPFNNYMKRFKSTKRAN